MREVIDKIRSKGFWDVAIRPEPYRDDRVAYDQLDEIVPSAAVRLRGWPVPFVDYREPFLRGEDWIGQDIDAEMVGHHEAWRFFTSGQFSHLRAVSADWRGGDEATPVPEGFESVIEVWEILFYLTEVFELATRLALGPAGDELMTVAVELNGLTGRALVVGQRNRISFVEPYRTSLDTLSRMVTLPREQLISGARSQAVEVARHFFLRFGWKPSVEQLTSHQQELDRL